MEVNGTIYRCPHCGRPVGADQLVAENDGDGDAALLSAMPPKHLHVTTEFAGLAQVTTITYRMVNPMVLFLIPFTCLWGGFSLTGIYGSQIIKHAFDPKLSLFGLPFLIGTIVLVCTIVFMCFGKRTLTLSAGDGRYFSGVGPFGLSKRFRYDRGTEVSVSSDISYGKGGPHTTNFIRLVNSGDANSVRICSGFSGDAAAYAAAVIRRECSRT